jgi:acyl-CoA synthetase (AMP-forming)/AMP-acid ligase II
MNAIEYLLQNGAREDEPALMTLSGDYTHGQLGAAVEHIARFLVLAGARKGERVSLVARNSLFWVATYLGSIRAGCICVPLAVGIENNELNYILQSASPRFVFVERGFAAQVLPSLAPQTTVVLDDAAGHVGKGPVVSFLDLLGGPDGQPACYPLIDEYSDLATLMFTSGSTGRPRGVMVSHRNIIANTASIVAYLGLGCHDRVMAVLPFYYCFGTSLLHTHLRVGGSLVIDDRFMYPNKVLGRMQETGCTGFAGVPSHYQILLRSSSLKQMRFPALRWVQQAGGNLPANFLEELRGALPGVRVFVMYGQTEATARLSSLRPELLEVKAGSIGKGIPGVRLQVLDESGNEVAPGQTGEIVAQGENITLGYWNDEHQTNLSFRAGKLHTGDIATVDEDGFVYIVDRAKDFLKCGGTRIACKYLEEKLLEFAEVVEAAVIGIQDPVLGEAVKVFVVPRNGAADLGERLHRFCVERLSPTLVPKHIVIVDSLPKNSAGKVLKNLLKCKSGPGEAATKEQIQACCGLLV